MFFRLGLFFLALLAIGCGGGGAGSRSVVASSLPARYRKIYDVGPFEGGSPVVNSRGTVGYISTLAPFEKWATWSPRGVTRYATELYAVSSISDDNTLIGSVGTGTGDSIPAKGIGFPLSPIAGLDSKGIAAIKVGDAMAGTLYADAAPWPGFILRNESLRTYDPAAGFDELEFRSGNAAGYFVGAFRKNDLWGTCQAAIYDPVTDHVTPLNQGPYPLSVAEGISDSGLTAGSCIEVGMLLFVSHAVVWLSGTPVVIDLPNSTSATVLAVSPGGIVVGAAQFQDHSKAFAYTQAQGTSDLNQLLPPDSGWVLEYATDVAANGYIAGFGTHNGQPRVFLLIP